MEFPNKQVPPVEAPKKHITPIFEAGVVTKAPRPATRRFLDYIFAENPKEVAKRVAVNTLGPRAKAAAEEALNGFLHSMLWGSGSAPISNIVKGTVLRGGNNVYMAAQQQTSLQMLQQSQPNRSSGIYEDVICPTQEHAERLLAQLYDIFNQYRVVAVADLYEMAGIEPSTADNAHGWLSLDGAKITKQREGFVLELPRPTRINN